MEIKIPTSVQNGAVTKYAYVYSVTYVNSKTGLETKPPFGGPTGVTPDRRRQRRATDAARVNDRQELGVQLHLFDTCGGHHPWTWGFYCDACERFFDLISDGSVEAIGNGYVIRRHSCGAEARYISFPEM